MAVGQKTSHFKYVLHAVAANPASQPPDIASIIATNPQIRPEPEGLAQIPEEFKKELIVGLLPKLDWEGLRETAADLGVAALPESMPEDAAENEAFLRSVHALVMEIHVKQAALVCKNCGRVYPVVKSVPNLMLTEDEV